MEPHQPEAKRKRFLLIYRFRLIEDKVPPELRAPFFHETLLRMLGVSDNFSQGCATGTKQGS